MKKKRAPIWVWLIFILGMAYFFIPLISTFVFSLKMIKGTYSFAAYWVAFSDPAFYRNFGYRACAVERWVQCGVIVRAGLAVDGQDPYLRQLQDAASAGEAGGSPVLPPAPASN